MQKEIKKILHESKEELHSAEGIAFIQKIRSENPKLVNQFIRSIIKDGLITAQKEYVVHDPLYRRLNPQKKKEAKKTSNDDRRAFLRQFTLSKKMVVELLENFFTNDIRERLKNRGLPQILLTDGSLKTTINNHNFNLAFRQHGTKIINDIESFPHMVVTLLRHVKQSNEQDVQTHMLQQMYHKQNLRNNKVNYSDSFIQLDTFFHFYVDFNPLFNNYINVWINFYGKNTTDSKYFEHKHSMFEARATAKINIADVTLKGGNKEVNGLWWEEWVYVNRMAYYQQLKEAVAKLKNQILEQMDAQG